MARTSNPASGCFDDNTAVEFMDGVLPPAEVARVEKHAAQCDACRRLLAELGRAQSAADPESSSVELGPTEPAGLGMQGMLATGQQVGRFVIINRLGSGGMGVVFAAYDPKLDRKVALKLLRSYEETSLSPQHAQMRLLREAQAIAQLSHHENVVTVYDYGTFKDEVYIAMEFVEGETLTHWLKRWERPWHDIIAKFLQAGRALAAAHSNGLVHRDFKPDNVLVGNDERVRVMDFGLARSMFADPSLESTIEKPPVPGGGERPPVPGRGKGEDGPAGPSQARTAPAGKAGQLGSPRPGGGRKPRTTEDNTPRALDHPLTKTGTVLGTPRYMAPEQFSAVVADTRSDQFSFCVALYESLYRQHPFEGRTAEGLVNAPDTTQVRTPPASTVVPSWLHSALLRGMASEPDRRFSSMDALLRAIEPPPPKISQYRLAIPLGVAALAILLAGYLFISKRNAEDDLDDAQTLIAKLEQRSNDLGSEVVKLTAELRVVRSELDRAPSSPVVVERLERELAATRQDLTNALVELEETQKKLDKYGGGKPRGENLPRSQGIQESEVSEAIESYRTDFEICFREWRERAQSVPPLYAVELDIASSGQPATDVLTAGIKDHIVHECVTGLFGHMRFRATRATTVVQIGFRHGSRGMTFSLTIKEVRTASTGERD